tara:strand:- start:159 stop:995 length:837 start_codon:yes stop_codon:yes gene_type:complete
MIEEEKYFFSNFEDNRVSQGISLEDIVKNTKIQEKYINAIEKGDFRELPSAYIRLFIKSYCKATNLNENEILNKYNDFVKGNKSISTNNKTPSFIKHKKKINNSNQLNSNLYKNNNSSYFIKSVNLLSFIITLSVITIIWLTLSQITKNANKKSEAMHDKTKISQEYIRSLTFFDSQTIEIKTTNEKNILKYNIPNDKNNKILIIDSRGINLENKILSEHDQGEKKFNDNISFIIQNGTINLFINEKKIDFKYEKSAAINGTVQIENKKLILLLEYYK